VDRWRFYLEIAYMISLLTQRTAPKEESRSMSALVQEVLPVLTGAGDFAAMQDAVAKVNVAVASLEQDLKKDAAVQEYRELIQKNEWVEVIDRLYHRLVVETESTMSRTPRNKTAAKKAEKEMPRQTYFRKLQGALMIFLQNRLGIILMLRHFYRTHYFYLPPEVPDFLPPRFLKEASAREEFKVLLEQEAIARRYLGRVPTGSKRRVRVVVPLEVAALLSRVVITKEKGVPEIALRPEPLAGPRGVLRETLPKSGLPDWDDRIVLRFYQENGAEMCYAINRHVWHAAQHDFNHRLGNHAYNCQILAARMAHDKSRPHGVDRIVDAIAAISHQQFVQIQEGSERAANIARAILTVLADSFAALASFAFTGRLPRGFVTALKRLPTYKSLLEGVTGAEIASAARHLRNLLDAAEGEDVTTANEEDLEPAEDSTPVPATPPRSVSFDTHFTYELGKTLNRRRLRPRLNYLLRQMTTDYRPKKGTASTSQENQRVLDILGWTRAKGLLLHLGRERDLDQLRTFADAWGQDPRTLVKKIPAAAREFLKQFTAGYPCFARYPPFPNGRVPVTTDRILERLREHSPAAPPDAPGTPQGQLTRDALLLAVMKALVMTAEQDPEKGREQGPFFPVTDNVKAKLLKMIYAHEFLLQKTSAADKKELDVNDVPAGGLRFLIDAPALIPSPALTKTLGWAVSDIVLNPFVTDNAMAFPVPRDGSTETRTLEQCEKDRMETFANARKNFGDAVQEVLGILAAAHAVGAQEKHWDTFVSLVDDQWNKRMAQVVAGNDDYLPLVNLFPALQEPAKQSLASFVTTVSQALKEKEAGLRRSLKPGKDKLKPLPLRLSSLTPTIGVIPPLGKIEQGLRDGRAVPFTEVLQLIDETKTRWQVPTAGGTTETLTAAYRPGSIPFCITSEPITQEEIRALDPYFVSYFGGQNPVRPEVDVPMHHVPGGRASKQGKQLGEWATGYDTKAGDLQRDVADTRTRMHQLRAFKIGIEQRLASRAETVITLVRLGYTVKKVAAELLARDMGVQENGSGSTAGLTRAEQAAIQKFLGSWTAGKNDPAKVNELAIVVQGESEAAPGLRVDRFLIPRVTALESLLDGLKVKTWPAKDYHKAAARGRKLAGIIGLHVSRLGYRARSASARRDFYRNTGERMTRAKKDEARAGAEFPRAAEVEALAFLRAQPLFKAFRDGDLFPCEIRLAKGVPVPGKSKDGTLTVYQSKGRLVEKVLKGTIDAIQIQVPLYPSGTVSANVLVKGPTLVAHSAPGHVEALAEDYEEHLDKTLVASFDDNRLNCPRTITPSLVQMVAGYSGGKRGVDPASPVEKWELELADWARLADVYNYAAKEPHEYMGLKKRAERGERGDGDLKLVTPAKSFWNKVLAAAFAPAGTILAIREGEKEFDQKAFRPTDAAPYDLDAPEARVPLDFRDKVGALMKYWGEKHAHLERHKATVLRKMRRLWKVVKTQPAGTHTPERGQWLRLRTQLYLLNRRAEHVRDADLEYLFRVVHYCQARSGAAYVVHENLSLSSGGEEGMGGLVASMLKDFKPAEEFLTRQFKALERDGDATPNVDGVSPAYTSLTCNYCARLGVSGELDNSASADYAICSTCGHVYDRHGGSTGNIGDRFVQTRFGAKKKKRVSKNAREKKEGDSKEPTG